MWASWDDMGPQGTFTGRNMLLIPSPWKIKQQLDSPRSHPCVQPPEASFSLGPRLTHTGTLECLSGQLHASFGRIVVEFSLRVTIYYTIKLKYLSTSKFVSLGEIFLRLHIHVYRDNQSSYLKTSIVMKQNSKLSGNLKSSSRSYFRATKWVETYWFLWFLIRIHQEICTLLSGFPCYNFEGRNQTTWLLKSWLSGRSRILWFQFF